MAKQGHCPHGAYRLEGGTVRRPALDHRAGSETEVAPRGGRGARGWHPGEGPEDAARRGAWRDGRERGPRARGGRARDGPGARRTDVGAVTPCTRQTTQKRRDNSPRGRPPALADPWESSPKMPFGAGSGPEALLDLPPSGSFGSGKRKQEKRGETGTHRPWSLSPHSDSSPLPPPSLNRYYSPWRRPREAGEGPDPELERLPFSWAITPRVPCSRRAGSAPRALASVRLR